MSTGFYSFDEYWSLFLARSCRATAEGDGLGRTGLSLARAAIETLSARPAGRRAVALRWAVFATLLSWGKLLCGTLDDEITEAALLEAAKHAPLALSGSVAAIPSVRENDARVTWFDDLRDEETSTAPVVAVEDEPSPPAQTGNEWAVWMS